MSLLEEENILKIYNKNLKKSIHLINRKDIFLVLTVLVLVITPLIIGILFNKEREIEIAPSDIYLTISLRSGELFGKALIEKFLLEYEEQNPGIRINTAVSGEEPDIYIFDEGEFSDLIAGNFLTELNSFTNYDSGSAQIAIPLVSFMDLFFYNIDILTAAGFDSPPKTRDEFLSYARAVSRSNLDASGFAIGLSRNDKRAVSRDIFSWIWASGSNFWTETGRPLINTRFIVNDFTFFRTLYREGLLTPDVFHATGDHNLEQFAQGKIAMMIASAGVIPYLREKMGDDKFGVTTIPDPVTGGRYEINISAIYAGMSANSAYPEEIWDFLVFLTEKSSVFCEELKAIPGIASNIIPGDYVSDDPFYSKAWSIYEFAGVAENFFHKPGAGEYYDVFIDELEVFFDSNRTAQQTVTAIQQRWDDIFLGIQQ